MKRIILILFLGFFCFAMKAQISTEEIPYSWKRSSNEIMKQPIPIITFSSLDMETIDREDMEDEINGIPPRFGFPHKVDYDLGNSGDWVTLPNGDRYCTGSLVNTTANDNRPLFLTADHCLGGWANNNIKYDAISNPNLNHYSFSLLTD